MTLLHLGLGIAGIACVAIPIIIHLLFRRKRKPIMWGAMRFVIEAYRKQRRRLTLEQLLLLAARCLVVLLLALAIARPILERAGALGGGSARTVYLLVDNGLASTVTDESGQSALERHKNAARQIIASLGASDRVGLVTLGAPASATVVPASTDLAAVRQLVDDIDATDAAMDLNGALDRLRAELGSEDEDAGSGAVVAILSDFLTGSADAGAPLPPVFGELSEVRVLAPRPRQSAPGNVQVVDVTPLRSVVVTGETGGNGRAPQTVRVALRRTGAAVAQPDATTVQARAVSGRAGVVWPATETVVRWAPGQSEATTSMIVDMGAAATSATESGSSVAIEATIDRDAVIGDNIRRAPVTVRESLRVGIIARRRFGAAPSVDRLDPADWLRLALDPTRSAAVEPISIDPASIDAPSLSAVSAVFVIRPDLVDGSGWDRLGRFVEGGGLVVVFPPTEPTVHLWPDEMARAFGLSWRLAREASEFEAPITLAADQPLSLALAHIREELKDLAGPVRVFKTLAIDGEATGASELVRLADGSAWIIAGGVEPRVKEDSAARVNQPSDQDSQQGAEPGASARLQAESRGLVVYVASAPTLSWTNLPAKPLMVPLMQELLRQGVGSAQGGWTTRAGAFPTAPSRSAELLPTAETGANLESILIDAGGRAETAARLAGLYRAVDGSGAARGLVAVNADADAGRTDVQAEATIQAWLATSGASAGSIEWIDDESEASRGLASIADEERSPVSFPLLLAALVVALMETVMARFFSHAITSSPSRRRLFSRLRAPGVSA